MRHYETVCIINPNLSDDEYQETITKFRDLVQKNHSEVIKVDEWGKKPLAYEVKKFDKGLYVLFEHCSPPQFVTELERHLKLDDRVLKYLTVKISDRADPEALKAKVKGTEEKGEGEVPLSPGSTGRTPPETKKQEGQNGI